ncbi:FAD-dependent monooxygenase [Paenibacillus sp. Z3-2]
MSQTILIIGGGIAVPCAAITLQQIGMKVKVYERNTAPPVAGAGIIIAPNALQALKPYRISDEIIRQGNTSDGFHILSDRGRCLRIHGNYRGAFSDYDARRRERIEQISNQSWKIRKMAQS